MRALVEVAGLRGKRRERIGGLTCDGGTLSRVVCVFVKDFCRKKVGLRRLCLIFFFCIV
jgi:hypothetical protein